MNLLISEPASSVLSLRPGSEKQSSLARKKASEGVLIVKTPKNCSRKAATRSQSRFPRPPTLTNAPDQQQHPLCSLTSLEANMGTPKSTRGAGKGHGTHPNMRFISFYPHSKDSPAAEPKGPPLPPPSPKARRGRVPLRWLRRTLPPISAVHRTRQQSDPWGWEQQDSAGQILAWHGAICFSEVTG